MYDQSNLRMPKAYVGLTEEEMEFDGGGLKWWAWMLIGVAAVGALCLVGALGAGIAGAGAAAGLWGTAATKAGALALGGSLLKIGGGVAGAAMTGFTIGSQFDTPDNSSEKKQLMPWEYTC